ncbi:Ig-like domain-containing protein [Anoxynatronum buryatiense]|uniref:Ig-like domain-containing protein n=1 Tax=Anoxynatronum buryatiense TaxID=489973 RepID=A0AA45WWH7_9CLOT|nr:Ig-like domain-containing protein [Anoxynatronum buryatiense]SMP60037.1 Ig-like domain-containing protein [Anoxynatronum buryatiense]
MTEKSVCAKSQHPKHGVSDTLILIPSTGFRWKKPMAMLMLVILLVSLLSLATYAEGDGDGEGGGIDPVRLEFSVPASGAVNVSPELETILLVFNKNVVYMTIRDANMAAISLAAVDGTPVAITIEMGDDQLYRELRRDVKVHLGETLKPDTEYILAIDPTFQAKNGTTLDSRVTVAFTTAPAAASQEQQETVEAPASPPQEGQAAEGAANRAEETAATDQSEGNDTDAQTEAALAADQANDDEEETSEAVQAIQEAEDSVQEVETTAETPRENVETADQPVPAEAATLPYGPLLAGAGLFTAVILFLRRKSS